MQYDFFLRGIVYIRKIVILFIYFFVGGGCELPFNLLIIYRKNILYARVIWDGFCVKTLKNIWIFTNKIYIFVLNIYIIFPFWLKKQTVTEILPYSKRNTKSIFFLMFPTVTSITHWQLHVFYFSFNFPCIYQWGNLWISKKYLLLSPFCQWPHLCYYYRFPMLIDPSEISGRFLQYRECTFINGLDHEFINSPDRIRIATLAALRSVKYKSKQKYQIQLKMLRTDNVHKLFGQKHEVL